MAMSPSLRISEYVSFYGERDFANVIKLRILSWEDNLDYPGGPKDPYKRNMEAWELEEM